MIARSKHASPNGTRALCCTCQLRTRQTRRPALVRLVQHSLRNVATCQRCTQARFPHQTKYRSDAAPIVEHAVGSVPGLEARDGSEQPAELNLDEIVGGLSHELLHGVVHARCVAMGIGVEFRCHRTWQNLRCAQVEWLAVSKSPRRRSDLVQVPASQGWSSVGDSSHCLNGRVRCGRSIGQQNDALLPGADFHPGFTAYGCQVLQALARAGCNRPRCQCLVGAVQTHLVTCSVR